MKLKFTIPIGTGDFFQTTFGYSEYRDNILVIGNIHIENFGIIFIENNEHYSILNLKHSKILLLLKE